MSCHECENTGVVPYVALDNPKADTDVTAEDLCYALCLCPAGQWMRSNRNAGKPTEGYGWQLWAATYGIAPERICRLEDAFEPEDIARAGFGPSPVLALPASGDIAAAMRTRKAKL